MLFTLNVTTKVSFMKSVTLTVRVKEALTQECIQVGCVMPAFQLYVFWWTPLDVSSSGVGVRYVQRGPLPCDLSNDTCDVT